MNIITIDIQLPILQPLWERLLIPYQRIPVILQHRYLSADFLLIRWFSDINIIPHIRSVIIIFALSLHHYRVSLILHQIFISILLIWYILLFLQKRLPIVIFLDFLVLYIFVVPATFLIVQKESIHLQLDPIGHFLLLSKETIDKSVISIFELFIHDGEDPNVVVIDHINFSKVQRWRQVTLIVRKEVMRDWLHFLERFRSSTRVLWSWLGH